MIVNPKMKEFILEGLPIVHRNGFNVWGCLVHAWHESGGFKHIIGNHNYWGITKPKDWTGLTVEVNTHEYEKNKEGKLVKVPRKRLFIDWQLLPGAMQWYCSFIGRGYPYSFKNRQEPRKYFKGFMIGKYPDRVGDEYATDPAYFSELIELYRTLTKNQEIVNLIKEIR